MKRVFPISLAGYCAALVLSSCATEEQEFVSLRPVYEEFYASTESSDFTRTHTDSQYRVLWNEDDRISIFNRDTYNQQYRFSGETGDNSGTFSMVPTSDFITANPIGAIYAVYPYAEGTRISNDEVLSVSLPSTQMWAQDSFGPGANVMVAAADDNKLMFKNAGGILSFKLYGANASVSSLQLKSNGGEAISGKASVTMTVGGLPVLTMDDSASDHVMLICPSPVTLNADASAFTEFWFVLPPVTLSGGFTLTVTSPDGGTFTKSSTKPLTISRNTISRMAPVEVEFTGGAVVQPNNEIWYTSTDGEIVSPYSGATDPFGDRTVVSNIYSDGKGIIVLDGDLTTIGVNAFSAFEKNNLETIAFPQSLITIQSSAFSYCSNLSSISFNDGLQSIGSYAFDCCKSLESVFIPSSVTTLGSGAFMECTGLSTFEGPYATDDGRFLIIGDTAYGFAPKGLVDVTIPDKVRVIAPGLFQWCYDIKRVKLPNQLVEIGSHAFYWTFIEEFSTLPETLETIGDGAFVCFRTTSFQGKYASEDGHFLVQNGELKGVACFGMEELVIPEGITSIGKQVITGFGINKLTLPASLRTIKTYAINECSELTELTVLAQAVPNGCPDLTDNTQIIYVPASSVDAYKSAQYWSRYADRIRPIPEPVQPDNEIWYTTTDGRPVSIANESVLNAAVVSNTYQNGKGIIKLDGPLTSIGTVKGSYSSDNDAFLTNNVAPNLKSISFPESLSVLCTYAVWNCSLLENVSLPAHLDYLGGSAFSDCHRITSLNIPECTEIRFNPFAGCTGLTQLTGSHVSSDGLFLIKDGTLHTFAMKGQISCAIPEGVANIAPYCFSGSTIEELTLPSSITKIGTNSFAGIRTLKRINFSEGLKSIGMHAFASSASLESVTLPQSLESLDYSAFANCSSLTTIHIPSGVNQLIQNPFPGCSSLSSFSGNFASADGRSLIDGDRLVSIAPAGLTTFAVPEGIRVLDWYLFAECSNLSGITIPEGVETVSNGCFNNCRALKELVMPSTWKEFDGSLFYGCTGLEKISILATVPPSNTINYVNKLFYSECTIYVPASSVEAYKSAHYWSGYADRIQPLAAVPEAVDLGLPSGLKWASFNLGATAPEGAGSFFAWGETLPKQYFGWDNYKWGTRTALTKYNSNSSLGTVDNLSELEAADDAAHAMLGGAWRMPTHSEQEELRDCCKWTVTTMNGVEGYLVSSKSNSNSIFLPITGTASGNEIRDTDEGYYWSSSLDSFSDENFYAAWFRLYLPQVTSTHANYGSHRCEGLAIRPVFN